MDLYINNQNEIYSGDKQDNDRKLSASEIADYFSEKKEMQKAQRKITKRQLLIWLYFNKQKTESDILTAINALEDESQKYLAVVSYQGTNDFYYGNEFVPTIGGALGLTALELDTMFDEAKNL